MHKFFIEKSSPSFKILCFNLYDSRNSAIKTSSFTTVELLQFMGEAKRRKEQGLPPRAIKKEKKDASPNIFQKLGRSQILPLVLAVGFVIFLIVDLVRYYNQ